MARKKKIADTLTIKLSTEEAYDIMEFMATKYCTDMPILKYILMEDALLFLGKKLSEFTQKKVIKLKLTANKSAVLLTVLQKMDNGLMQIRVMSQIEEFMNNYQILLKGKQG